MTPDDVHQAWARDLKLCMHVLCAEHRWSDCIFQDTPVYGADVSLSYLVTAPGQHPAKLDTRAHD